MKSVGDEVAVGDELVEIETDKANMVYESDEAGTLIEIVAEEGATLPIGEVIARIGDAGEEPQRRTARPPPRRTRTEVRRSEPTRPNPTPDARRGARASRRPTPGAADAAPTATARGSRPRPSPGASRKDKGVDSASLSGSGPAGGSSRPTSRRPMAVRRGAPAAETDARGRRAGSPTPAPARSRRPPRATAEVVELTKLQQTVARRMAESKATAPHFYLPADDRHDRAVEARARLKARPPRASVVPTFNDMVVKACALALREFPRANGAYRDGKVEQYSRVNVGVAVAAQDALVVPTVFDADRKGLRQIASRDPRAGRTGPRGHDHAAGAVRRNLHRLQPGDVRRDQLLRRDQPAAGGDPRRRRDRPKPVVRDGEIVAAQLMGVTLACDHRILYGADGAEFLRRIRELLAEPLALAL